MVQLSGRVGHARWKVNMNTLDVGCGNFKAPGAVGIDFNPSTAADIVHDLNRYPWPLEDNTFDRIVCRHIVEHVTDMVHFMEEIHRVGRQGLWSKSSRRTFPIATLTQTRPTCGICQFFHSIISLHLLLSDLPC